MAIHENSKEEKKRRDHELEKRRSAMRKGLTLSQVVVFICFIGACLTVNVYFYPSKEVDTAAKKIVEDIRSLEVPPDEDTTVTNKGGESSWLDSWKLIVSAEAAEADISVSNPAILAIKEKMKVRAAALMPFFEAGAIGEGKDGFVAVRDTSAISMQERAKLNPLVKAENDDRRELYKEVAKALGVKESDLDKVQESFAKEWQRSAKPGWWVEDASGTWKKR